MIKAVSEAEVREKFKALIEDVHLRHDRVVVTRSGKPVAAIIDIDLFHKIQTFEEEFEIAVGDLQRAFKGESIAAIEGLVKQAKRNSRKRH